MKLKGSELDPAVKPRDDSFRGARDDSFRGARDDDFRGAWDGGVGFSLIELLIVISIISVMLAFAIPSQKPTASHTQHQIMSSQLLRAIHAAQDEAMIRQETITLEKNPGGWQEGYHISSDTKLLYAFTNPKNNGVLHWRAFPVHRTNLQFARTGASRAENGTFWYCQKNNTQPQWAIVINQAGRARAVYPNKWGDIESDKPLLC